MAGQAPSGLVLVDKPAGITSHDVVYRVRREWRDRLGTKVKTGHAGTLDPFATGLLVVLLGRATRLQRYVMSQRKTYRAVARLGWTSDSGDRDGELTETGRVPVDPQIPAGELSLAVPAYSAIKVGGERLYAKARRGESFEPPVRQMTVYRAERMRLTPERATFEIECSSGTYVRSLVANLEDAYCEELVRTRIGDLRLEDADPGRVVEPLAALTHLPRVEGTETQVRCAIYGQDVDAGETEPHGDPVALVYEGRLAGILRWREGRLRPETMLVGDFSELEAA